MSHLRRYAGPARRLSCPRGDAGAAGAAQKREQGREGRKEADAKRPQITLKAQPVISMSPASVVLTAELVGGANDFEEFYCPTIEWDWGDGTHSESTADCAPYEAGKSEIKRRFTVEHVFRRPDNYRVTFRLKRRDKAVGSATIKSRFAPVCPKAD